MRSILGHKACYAQLQIPLGLPQLPLFQYSLDRHLSKASNLGDIQVILLSSSLLYRMVSRIWRNLDGKSMNLKTEIRIVLAMQFRCGTGPKKRGFRLQLEL